MPRLFSTLLFLVFIGIAEAKWWGWSPEYAVNATLNMVQFNARQGNYPLVKRYFAKFPEILDTNETLREQVMEGIANLQWTVHSAKADMKNNKFGRPIPQTYTANVTFVINGTEYDTIVKLPMDKTGPNGRKIEVTWAPESRKLTDVPLTCLISVVLCVLIDVFG